MVMDNVGNMNISMWFMVNDPNDWFMVNGENHVAQNQTIPQKKKPEEGGHDEHHPSQKEVPSGKLTSLLKMVIYSEFSH